MARASQRPFLLRLRLGDPQILDMAFSFPIAIRQLCGLAIVNKSKNIHKPIDTSYLNFKNLNGFEDSCNLVKKLGFGGKACIHPNQIDISNKIFT